MSRGSRVPRDAATSKEMRNFLDDIERQSSYVDRNGNADFTSLSVGGEDVFSASDIATQAEAEAGASNAKIMSPLRTKQAIQYGRRLFYAAEVQSAGTNGGTFTGGSYFTRALNTVYTNDISGASLSSNQITLPAGAYEVQASAPAFSVQRHKIRLYDTTNSTVLLMGSAEHVPSGSQTRSFLVGEFTLSGTAALALQHRGSSTAANEGLGLAANWGDAEVYAQIMIWAVY